METKLLKMKALPRTKFVKPKPMNYEKAEKKERLRKEERREETGRKGKVE